MTTRWTLSAFVIVLAANLSACAADTYRPFYYPDAADLTVYTRGPVCDNLAQARQWAEDQHRQRQDASWTYEIGRNCKPLDDTDMVICQETVK